MNDIDLNDLWDDNSVDLAAAMLKYENFDPKSVRSEIINAIKSKVSNSEVTKTILILVSACMRNKRPDMEKRGFSEAQSKVLDEVFKIYNCFPGAQLAATKQARSMQQVVASFPDIAVMIAFKSGVARNSASKNIFMRTPGFWSPQFVATIDLVELQKNQAAYNNFLEAYMEFCSEFNEMINAKNPRRKTDEWKNYIQAIMNSNAVNRNAFFSKMLSKDEFAEVFSSFGFEFNN